MHAEPTKPVRPAHPAQTPTAPGTGTATRPTGAPTALDPTLDLEPSDDADELGATLDRIRRPRRTPLWIGED